MQTEDFIKTQKRLREFQSALNLNSDYIKINDTNRKGPIINTCATTKLKGS